MNQNLIQNEKIIETVEIDGVEFIKLATGGNQRL